jgi:ABC-type nitrate/sulfonate/bicarbonate transport system substrate-binding protein
LVAAETGLFNKHGLKVKLQQLNPQSSVPAVISESADRPSPLEEI